MEFDVEHNFEGNGLEGRTVKKDGSLKKKNRSINKMHPLN